MTERQNDQGQPGMSPVDVNDPRHVAMVVQSHGACNAMVSEVLAHRGQSVGYRAAAHALAMQGTHGIAVALQLFARTVAVAQHIPPGAVVEDLTILTGAGAVVATTAPDGGPVDIDAVRRWIMAVLNACNGADGSADGAALEPLVTEVANREDGWRWIDILAYTTAGAMRMAGLREVAVPWPSPDTGHGDGHGDGHIHPPVAGGTVELAALCRRVVEANTALAGALCARYAGGHVCEMPGTLDNADGGPIVLYLCGHWYQIEATDGAGDRERWCPRCEYPREVIAELVDWVTFHERLAAEAAAEAARQAAGTAPAEAPGPMLPSERHWTVPDSHDTADSTERPTQQ